MRQVGQWCLVAMVMVAMQSTSQAADDVNDLIAKAIKAHGGEEALAKGKAHQWKVKGVAEILNMKMEYTSDYSFQAPNQFRFAMKADVGGMKIEITAATDGKVCWEQSGDQMREMEAKKGKAFMHNVHTINASMLVGLKDKDNKLSLADEVMVEGKPAVGVKIEAKGHADVYLYFDKTTYLTVKSKTTMWDEFTDKEISQESLFLDYKDKNGVKNFHKLVIKRDGKAFITEEMSDMKIVDKLDAKLFAKPGK